MSIETLVLAASAALQLTAAALAIRLIRTTGWRVAWVVIAAALVLMVVRRAIILVGMVGGRQAVSLDLTTEAVGLAVAALMLVGVASIGPLLQRLKRTDLMVLESERRFRSLIEHGLDIITMLDGGGTVLYASPSISRVLGYEPAKVIGTSVLDGVHPEDRPAMERFFAEWSRRPGVAPPVAFRFRHKSGYWRHIEAVANNLLDDPSVGAIVVNARDVSDRERAEAELRSAEHRLATVVGNASLVLFAIDRDGKFTLSEGRGLATLGLRPGEVVGQSVWELYRDQPTVIEQLERAFNGDEFRDIVEVGGELVFDVFWRPVRAGDGSVTEVVGVATDVTDRERTWEALQQSESVYRALVEQSSDPIYIFQDDRFVVVNEAFAGLFGYDRETILAGEFEYLQIVAPQSRSLIQERARRRAAGETQPSMYEFDALTKDGRVLKLEVSVAEVVWRGRPAVQGIYRDVSERRRAEAALRESEAQYRGLVEHATYGMYRSTPDGRFVAVNPALVRMLGYESEAELLASDMAHDVYRDTAERDLLMRQYADAERIEGVEVAWRRRDGSPIVVRLGGRPIRNAAGEVESYEMIVEDVTERRALEEQLRQAQKMEAIGQLTGGIAHDFNNLLTVILANADILERSLPDSLPESREDLADLRKAARRGSDMVKKLLGYSRRGMLALRMQNLADTVAELLPTLRRLLPENIEVAFEPRTADAAAVADEGALQQIVFNLVTNARDAMPEGGTLTVKVSRVILDAQHSELMEWGASGEYVVVTVADTGEGMSEETRERIFDPFFTTKPAGVGTGLGMAMVYGLIKQQGGFIDIQSVEGEGTTVDLYFPPVAADTLDEKPAPGAGSDGHETILLVEDEANVRRSAKRLLEKKGYRVLPAADGEEALALFEEHGADIDLVISDVIMPKVGGGQLYQELTDRYEQVRFLFTSGYTPRDVRVSGGVDPRVPFLAKPWDVDELLRTVRDVLDGRQ